jgi:hypothetical protein
MGVSSEHEGVIALLRAFPQDIRMVAHWTGHELPSDFGVRVVSGDLGVVQPVERRADLVMAFAKPGEEQPELVLVVEVQRDVKLSKLATWPEYYTSARRQFDCEVQMLVLCTNRRTADWLRGGFDTGCGNWHAEPWIAGPDEIPPAVGPGLPWLHVALSAVVHGRDRAVRRQVYRALAEALEMLPVEEQRYYIGWVSSAATPAARKDLESAVMLAAKKRKRHASLVDDLLAEGQAKGSADALVTVLTVRGFVISPELRKRIEACDDVQVLNEWTARAVTAADVDTVFANSEA